MTRKIEKQEDLFLLPSEVAALWRVSAKTVGRWALAKKLSFTRTPGGHLRFRRSDVEEFMLKNFAPAEVAQRFSELDSRQK